MSEEMDNTLRSVANNSVSQLPVPTKGDWSGERGNSRFTPADDAAVVFWAAGKRCVMSGVAIKRRMILEYGTDSVLYSRGEPDFSPFIDKRIGAVEVAPFSPDRDANFRVANGRKARELGCESAAIKTEMRERGLTWHECGNRKTLLAVPTYVHAAFPHGGGIAVQNSISAISANLSRRFPNGFKLARQEQTLHVERDDLDTAIKGMRRVYREERKEMLGGKSGSTNDETDGKALSTRELAEIHGVSGATIRRWCRTGKLEGAAKGADGRWRVRVMADEHRPSAEEFGA